MRTTLDRVTVLLVDGEGFTRQETRKSLDCDKGVRVVGDATTAHEALQLIKESQPDAVIPDA